MTPLRKRMLDAMVLRGFAQRTQETYLGAVIRMAQHYDCSPDLLSDEQLQAYLLHLLQERHRSRSTVNLTSCAVRFLVCDVLGQTERRVQIPLGRSPQRLPELLSRAEIAALFGSLTSIKARTFLMTAYASGLRLSELCHLRGCDIDSAPDRMCIRVVQGKGAKDRYSLLTHLTCSHSCACTGVPLPGWRQSARLVVYTPVRSITAFGPWEWPVLLLHRSHRCWHHQGRRHSFAAPCVCHPFIGSGCRFERHQ
jgi:Phage integrase, N-terminal SAM-like domain/Phage integrase family